MAIHLDLTLPPNSSSLPEDLGEQPLNVFCLTLLPMRLAMRLTVTRSPVVSYTAVSPLPKQKFRRSILCCAISQVALGGRYPPLCSVEPGSSSVTPNEHCDRGHRETSTFLIIADTFRYVKKLVILRKILQNLRIFSLNFATCLGSY